MNTASMVPEPLAWVKRGPGAGRLLVAHELDVRGVTLEDILTQPRERADVERDVRRTR